MLLHRARSRVRQALEEYLALIDVEAFSCQELVELVTDYLEGALSIADMRRFEAHIGGCDGCTEYVTQFRR